MKTTFSAFTLAALLAGCAIAGDYDNAYKQLDQKQLNTIDGVTGPDYYKGVSLEEGGLVELDKEVGLNGHYLRSRFVLVEPGGIVKLHKHQNRPAFTYVAEGEVVEFRNDATETGVRKQGTVTTDSNGLVQWWRNDGDVTARLYVVDVVSKEEVNPSGRD